MRRHGPPVTPQITNEGKSQEPHRPGWTPLSCRIAAHTRLASTCAETCVRVATQLHCGSPSDRDLRGNSGAAPLRLTAKRCVGTWRRLTNRAALALSRVKELVAVGVGVSYVWLVVVTWRDAAHRRDRGRHVVGGGLWIDGTDGSSPWGPSGGRGRMRSDQALPGTCSCVDGRGVQRQQPRSTAVAVCAQRPRDCCRDRVRLSASRR